MSQLVDLVMRIQPHIRLRIMTLVADGTAGVIRPTTKKAGVELLLRFFTQALLGQIMTGNATELAIRTLDSAAKPGRHLCEHFLPGLDARRVDIVVKRHGGMTIIADDIDILIAQI